MSNAQPRVNKLSLVNTLLQTELHNRMQEEQDMWRKYKKLKRKRERTSSDDSSGASDKNHRKQKKKKKRKRKDDLLVLEQPRNSTECSIQQVKTISSGERWGHDGFMELHPEAVISGNCFNSQDTGNDLSVRTNIAHKKTTKKKSNKHKVKKNLSTSDNSDSSESEISKKSKKHKSKSSKHKKKR